eukprot:Transcript_14214.p1 GENE.Transcript_14214~~Transcript_14214.p1  ORF type:complete len:453 (-),score=67.51 Transcript_14214:97-1314(-)
MGDAAHRPPRTRPLPPERAPPAAAAHRRQDRGHAHGGPAERVRAQARRRSAQADGSGCGRGQTPAGHGGGGWPEDVPAGGERRLRARVGHGEATVDAQAVCARVGQRRRARAQPGARPDAGGARAAVPRAARPRRGPSARAGAGRGAGAAGVGGGAARLPGAGLRVLVLHADRGQLHPQPAAAPRPGARAPVGAADDQPGVARAAGALGGTSPPRRGAPTAGQPYRRTGSLAQVRSVAVPDVAPWSLPPDAHLSMCAGDFLEVYRDQRAKWDALLSCFFIDTAHDLTQYLARIAELLVPGGLWINLGPLLWHFADNPHEVSVDLTWDEVRPLILDWGFVLEREEWRRCTYTRNPASLYQMEYECIFFVARWPGGATAPGSTPPPPPPPPPPPSDEPAPPPPPAAS